MTQLIVADLEIRQDEEGRYCLNDLHKAAGGLKKHQLSNWHRTDQTQELIAELTDTSNMRYPSVLGNRGTGTLGISYKLSTWRAD